MTDSSNRATSMADLLQKQKIVFVSTKKGETVKGKITKLTSSEILLDINAKTEAVVLEKERRIMRQLLGMLKVGETVTATVLNPESDMGYTVVSLRRFAEDTLWYKLEKLKKEKEKIIVTVKENTKGGLLVAMIDGTTGFLPNSHMSYTQNHQQIVGQAIEVIIVELDKNNRKIVFSQKAAAGDEEYKKAKKVLKVNEKITVTVINATSFGIFVSVPVENAFIDGLIHISEVSWEKTENIGGMFEVGQGIEAIIIGFDDDAKRVDLSIKRLHKDPFAEVILAFPIDRKTTGTVREINAQGVVLDLGSVGANDLPVQGLIKKDKVPPGMTYIQGQQVTATVSQIEEKKRRILLVPVLKEKPIGYR